MKCVVKKLVFLAITRVISHLEPCLLNSDQAGPRSWGLLKRLLNKLSTLRDDLLESPQQGRGHIISKMGHWASEELKVYGDWSSPSWAPSSLDHCTPLSKPHYPVPCSYHKPYGATYIYLHEWKLNLKFHAAVTTAAFYGPTSHAWPVATIWPSPESPHHCGKFPWMAGGLPFLPQPGGRQLIKW